MKQFFTAFFLFALSLGATAQIIYQQDFENGLEDMTLINNDGKTPASALSTFTDAWNVREDVDGNAAISISWYAPPGLSDDWMITPVISGITANTVVEWDARAIDPSYPDGYKVMVSTGGNTIADFTDQIFLIAGEDATGGFTHRAVSLAGFAGQDIHIAFVNNSNDQYVLAVDNIVVRSLVNVDAYFVKVEVADYVRTGEATYLNYTIQNQGIQTLDTLTITWSDGTNTYEETLTGLNLAFGDTYEGTLSDAFTADNANEYELTFAITGVGNGVDELPDNNFALQVVSGVSAIVPKKIVAEEATGSWCGYCPRGAIFMELMEEQYADLFIPIAVHNADPMAVTEYDAGITNFPEFPGFPAVIVDRKQIIDPSELEATIEALRDEVTPVAVEVHASIDSLARKMYIEGKVTTYTNRTTAHLNLVLVVAENDVRGTASGYNQTNYYAANALGTMGGYENLPDPVPAANMIYDFVARKLIYGFDGSSTVIPATINVDDEFNFTASYIFPATLDMDQLYVVAMVVDSVSGNVLNATKSDAATSAVKEIKELGALKIYPNPAQTMTYVDMELTEAANVTLELVNQLGQTVRMMDQGKLPAGHSVVPVKVAGLSAGIYMVKMNIAGKSLLRKLVID